DSGKLRGPLGKMNSVGVFLVRQALQEVWRENPEILQPLEKFYGVNLTERLEDDKIWQALAA
ncbi:MAG TPA: 4-hydroxy-tetrahydrodipicolinate synthase, partial [Patescibacteria group bacterium]|nr:4-hydroxy-tetrahydrodipicolinate synthase [Patescibacteria group bacterium]